MSKGKIRMSPKSNLKVWFGFLELALAYQHHSEVSACTGIVRIFAQLCQIGLKQKSRGFIKLVVFGQMGEVILVMRQNLKPKLGHLVLGLLAVSHWLRRLVWVPHIVG